MNLIGITGPALLVALLSVAAGCIGAAPEAADTADTTVDAITAVSCSQSLTAAAVTRQVVSVDEPTRLTVELVTLTPAPYMLRASSLTFPPGFALVGLASKPCTLFNGTYRCAHEATLEATTACTGTGSYTMWLDYRTTVTGGCWGRPTQTQRVDFSLTTENFCAVTTVR